MWMHLTVSSCHVITSTEGAWEFYRLSPTKITFFTLLTGPYVVVFFFAFVFFNLLQQCLGRVYLKLYLSTILRYSI